MQGECQEVAIWAWTRDVDAPLLRERVLNNDRYHEVKFSQTNKAEVSATGNKTVIFWTWEELKLEGYMGKVSKTDFGNYSGKHTSTTFLGDTGNAVTSTDEGFIVLWASQFSSILLDDPSCHQMKMAAKVVRLVECGITTMTTTAAGYLVLGCQDGAVRFCDFSLRLEAWFEDLAAGPVSSISFATQTCPFTGPGEGGQPGTKFWVPDFMVPD